jgi:hypothetical protein
MSKTIQEKKGGVEQLSNRAIRERLRKHVPNAVERLVELMSSNNDPVALGATKEIISKFIPNRKATELSSEDGNGLEIIITDRTSE